MKKLLIASSAFALLSSPAFAQSSQDSQDFTVNGTVENECSIENPADVTLGEFAVITTPGADALQYDDNKSDSQTFWMSCNYTTSIAVESDNLALVGDVAPTDSQFTNRLDYRLNFSTVTGTALTGLGSIPFGVLGNRTRTQASEFHANVQMDVVVPKGEYSNASKRLVAGNYSDRVVITLGTL
ncbi:MAG: hypothetical protein AAFZ11_11170 [Pseudomonadota bacterium]